jgi:hypothetical protein
MAFRVPRNHDRNPAIRRLANRSSDDKVNDISGRGLSFDAGNLNLNVATPTLYVNGSNEVALNQLAESIIAARVLYRL